MNIILAHGFYKQLGGEDRCVKAEAALLKSHGHNVIEFFFDNAAVDGMSQLQVAAGSIWSGRAYNQLRKLCRQHQPQVVHFHNTLPLISPSAYYAAKAEGVAVVQTLHNFRLACPNGLFFRNGRVCEDCVGRPGAWPAVAFKCYRDSRAASATVSAMLTAHRTMGTWRNAVDVYIALTQFQKSKLIKGGLPASKIMVKPNSVPQSAIGYGDGDYALFVGRLSSEKGLNTLLEAWHHLPCDTKLKIVGEGPQEDLVKEAAAKDQRVEWLQHLPISQVYEVVGDASVLIVPSVCYENFPRVIVEAFSKGTPVICSRFGSMAEIVADGSEGLHFAPGDAIDLAQKVRHFFDQRDLIKQMRMAAHRKYVQHLSPDSNHAQLMHIYQSAIAERSVALPVSETV